jgi:hypothetical protein
MSPNSIRLAQYDLLPEVKGMRERAVGPWASMPVNGTWEIRTHDNESLITTVRADAMRFSGELRSFSWTLRPIIPARDHMTVEIQVRPVPRWLPGNVLFSTLQCVQR